MTKDQVKIVMLVDDNPTDRFIHSKLLGIYQIGDKVLEFEGGREAIHYLREEGEAGKDLPDLILLDVSMPEMNGFDCLAYIDEAFRKLAKKPVIFMLSSTDDEGDLRKARKSPLVRKMLKKPFAPDTLIKALSEVS